MEINEFGMVKLIHDINLLSYQLFLHSMRNRNEFCSKDISSLSFTTSVNNTKCSSTYFFKDIIQIIYACGLDIHWLRNILGVDIKHILIIIIHLSICLTTNLLSSSIHFILFLLDNLLATVFGLDKA